MKKTLKKATIACLLTAAVAMSIPVSASAAAGSGAPGIMVNGMPIPVDTYLTKNDHTYVNVAALAELVGFAYTLDAEAGTVTVNGKTIEGVEVKDGLPYAHVRVVAAAAGASSVTWDQATKTVVIVYNSKLVVYGDTVSQLGECVIQNRFVVGDAIIFRMTALHPVTGQLVESAKLQVHLSTGEVLDMQLGEHPPGVPGAEKFWTARYDVTDETPKGTLSYYVTAESGDLKGEYKPFNVLPSLITIVPADQGAAASEE